MSENNQFIYFEQNLAQDKRYYLLIFSIFTITDVKNCFEISIIVYKSYYLYLSNI